MDLMGLPGKLLSLGEGTRKSGTADLVVEPEAALRELRARRSIAKQRSPARLSGAAN
jgi:hypothetical protein